jgi:toxin ParE1/3/4
MMAWRLTNPAKDDLDEIWWYIAQDNVAAADKMISRLVGRFDMLARQPLIGEECSALAIHLRNFPVRPYVIYYMPVDEEVAIIRVLHGARDARRSF